MSSGITVSVEPSASNNAQPDSRYLGQWIGWVGTAVKTLVTNAIGLFSYDLHTQSSSPASSHQMLEKRTAEKMYRINDNGRVLKRSLRQDEYHILSNGEPFVPILVVERLRNEAACMEFIKNNTNIPVPKLLETYEENGSYWLWMEFIDGVEMSDLTDTEQSEVFPQSKRNLINLINLRGLGH